MKNLFLLTALSCLALAFAVLAQNDGSPAVATTFRVTDTHQTACFDENGSVITCAPEGEPLCGQDAQRNGLQPSYRDNGDGRVTDLNTGLMWQKGYAGGLNWKDALAYAENLTLAGYTDWRLPNIKELQSIVDYEHYDWNTDTAAIDLTYFESPTADYSKNQVIYFWSGTTHGDFPSAALYVSFGHAMSTLGFDAHGAGAVRSDPKTGDPADWPNGIGPDMPDVVSILNYVRAVRGGSFSLTSDVGVDGGTLPAEYTCDGTGSSPALSWSNAPAGTVEFTLMMTTIPVDGATKWSWVLYGIPGSTTGLVKNSSGVGILGMNSHGTTAYAPPCSQGPGPKLYTFTVHALSASPTLPGAPDQVTGDVLTEAISSITLGSASLSLSYTRPGSALSAAFAWAPESPTDDAPIAFTASATGGTPPYTYAWDLCGAAASGDSVTETLAPGSCVVTLTVADSAGLTATAVQTVEVGFSIAVSGAQWLSNPGRLKVSGSGFGAGCQVKVGGVAVPQTVFKSAYLLLAKGNGLKAMVPKGVTVQITVVSADGRSSAPFPFTR